MFLQPIGLTIAISSILLFGKTKLLQAPFVDVHKKYYFSASGSDKSNGSIDHPFRSLEKLNSLPLHAGDSVYLNAGDLFKGRIIIDSLKSGSKEAIISISSFGDGQAIIDAGNNNGIMVDHSSFISLSNLIVKGNGRKSGNTKDGIIINNSKNISVNNIEISGFQKSGLLIYASSAINSVYVYAHNNGSAGITVEGDFSNKLSSHHICITGCRAVNNPGDPTNLTNHSGNGIVVGHCTAVLINKCMATDNGWDMPRIGNGPVGIWAYEADSIIIQRCLSFRNKTAPKAADGGGFDLDGGVTNSVIQYCLSYDNQGAGYCMFQYWGASPWHNNVIRFNISENDGTVSDAHGGAYIWNSSGDENQFYNCDFYNNSIYNSKVAALSYSEKSLRKNFRFCNNIFVAIDTLIYGEKSNDVFLGNDWWSMVSKFNADHITDFSGWAKNNEVEMISGKLVGLNSSPSFNNPGKTSISSPEDFDQFLNYNLPSYSALQKNGVNLKKLYNIDNGGFDFFLHPVPQASIGACFNASK
ncbi:MAG TPA: right-handed parallel beta-helix repeat-containing protein [Puia sp.]|nr:right-handed parallel beta-helix repeat-containing protein [Puia sp.]